MRVSQRDKNILDNEKEMNMEKEEADQKLLEEVLFMCQLTNIQKGQKKIEKES